ncbi:hypothetical protein [Pseudonocardia sp. H11422]|uniref:hypothetical protein n=1 Tax=Pseudonocardia sp. H11422 TaxID=2835866 RepID=UPI001BDD6FA7|nr:hypothetical protein [Pseudonocardia sp. H11422]
MTPLLTGQSADAPRFSSPGLRWLERATAWMYASLFVLFGGMATATAVARGSLLTAVGALMLAATSIPVIRGHPYRLFRVARGRFGSLDPWKSSRLALAAAGLCFGGLLLMILSMKLAEHGLVPWPAGSPG